VPDRGDWMMEENPQAIIEIVPSFGFSARRHQLQRLPHLEPGLAN